MPSDQRYHFGQAFLNELIEFGTSNFAGLPCSTVFVTLIFMLDTTLRSSTAKLYFVCGYFIELLLFYSIGVICFPPTTDTSPSTTGRSYNNARSSFQSRMYDDDDDSNMFRGGGGENGSLDVMLNRVRFLSRPFQHFTNASFFNFSAGYILGYWGNLNILTETKNATIVNCYYTAFVLFCFLFSVFYLPGVTTWQSALVSVVAGIIGGMLCSSTIASRVKLESGYDDQLVMSDTNSQTSRTTSPPSGVMACDSKNNDMVCRVFRAAS